MDKKPTRREGKRLRVPVLTEEEAIIKEKAAAHGLSVAEYMRRLALNLPITSVLDHRAVVGLAKVNADQGRLGGLLKLWLTNDEKLMRKHSPVQLEQMILGVLKDIKAFQDELLMKVKDL